MILFNSPKKELMINNYRSNEFVINFRSATTLILINNDTILIEYVHCSSNQISLIFRRLVNSNQLRDFYSINNTIIWWLLSWRKSIVHITHYRLSSKYTERKRKIQPYIYRWKQKVRVMKKMTHRKRTDKVKSIHETIELYEITFFVDSDSYFIVNTNTSLQEKLCVEMILQFKSVRWESVCQ